MASGAGVVTLKFAGDLTELQKALGELPADVQHAMGVTAKVTQKAAADHASSTASAHTSIGGHVAGIAGKVGKAGAAVAAVGGGVTAALEPITEALGKTQDLTSQLGTAIQNAGGQTDGWKEALENTEGANRKLGVSNEDTVESVQALVQAGVPWQQAMGIQTQILDIATAKHENLATATDQVIKATQGHVKGLADLGVTATKAGASQAQLAKDTAAVSKLQEKIPLDQDAVKNATDKVTQAQAAYTAAVKAHGAGSAQAQASEDALRAAKDNQAKASQALASDEASLAAARQKQAADQASSTQHATTLNDVLAETQKHVGGEAAASADTMAGHMRVVKAEVGNVVEAIGQHMLPVLQVAGPAITGIGGAVGAAGGAVEGFKKIQELFTGATEAATVATEAQTVATDAGAVSADALGVSEGIALGPIVLIVAGIAALVAAVILIVTHFQKFKDILGDIGNFVKSVFVAEFDFIRDLFTKTIPGWIDDVVGFFTGIPGRLAALGSSIGNGILGLFKTGVNDVIGLLNAVLKTIGDIGGSVGPFSFHIRDAFGGHMPTIPGFATGGIVPGPLGAPMLALVHGGEEVRTPGQQRAAGARIGAGPQAPSVYISATTNATAADIAREASFALRRGGY